MLWMWMVNKFNTNLWWKKHTCRRFENMAKPLGRITQRKITFTLSPVKSRTRCAQTYMFVRYRNSD